MAKWYYRDDYSHIEGNGEETTYKTKLQLDKGVGRWSFPDEMELQFVMAYVIDKMLHVLLHALVHALVHALLPTSTTVFS